MSSLVGALSTFCHRISSKSWYMYARGKTAVGAAKLKCLRVRARTRTVFVRSSGSCRDVVLSIQEMFVVKNDVRYALNNNRTCSFVRAWYVTGQLGLKCVKHPMYRIRQSNCPHSLPSPITQVLSLISVESMLMKMRRDQHECCP